MTVTLSVVLLGFAASLVTEIVTWLNKKLSGSVFKGNGALLVSAVVALVAGYVQQFFFSGAGALTWSSFFAASGTAFAFSQVWFNTIMTWFDSLQVSPSATV